MGQGQTRNENLGSEVDIALNKPLVHICPTAAQLFLGRLCSDAREKRMRTWNFDLNEDRA